MIMVNCTCPFVVCDVNTCASLYVIWYFNYHCLFTQQCDNFTYKPQEVYFTLLQTHIEILAKKVANGYLKYK